MTIKEKDIRGVLKNNKSGEKIKKTYILEIL